jgi:uncharacterized protein (TIGR02246 family)
LAATFRERYNKQDADAIASMFTKDAVRVTSGVSSASVGPQAIEETFKTQFKSGFRHIDLVIDQVSPLGTDAAITVGAYQITGQGQGDPAKGGRPLDGNRGPRGRSMENSTFNTSAKNRAQCDHPSH